MSFDLMMVGEYWHALHVFLLQLLASVWLSCTASVGCGQCTQLRIVTTCSSTTVGNMTVSPWVTVLISN